MRGRATALAALVVWCGLAAEVIGRGSATPGRQQGESAGPVTGQASDAPVILQLRVYNGTEEMSAGTRVNLFARGQRTDPIPLVQTADRAYEAKVAAGFYDVQVVREEDGQVAGIRWVEQLLVQRYPDEYGRHLKVVNFRPEFGALQVRPAPADESAARGWAAAAYRPGDEARDVARGRAIGPDVLIVVPGGRYDIKVTLADKSVHWLRDVEIPADGTRLKTWSPAPASP